MEEIDNKKVKGCELLIPEVYSSQKVRLYSIKIQDSSQRNEKKKKTGDNYFAFKSDLATSNYMRYYKKNAPIYDKIPDILHVWSIRNKKLVKYNRNQYLQTKKILASVDTKVIKNKLSDGRVFNGMMKAQTFFDLFKAFNDHQSFDHVDIFNLLKSQVSIILNMVPKNYEYLTHGKERAGLFDPVESLNC